MTRALLPMFLLATSCAPASAPAPASALSSAPAPAPALSSASASAPPSALGPLPTGGMVLVGEVLSPPSFDPKPTLDGLKPELLSCYNRARQQAPALHGKLKLRINVNEGGSVLLVEAEPGSSAADPGLVACMGEAIKAAHFPKPPGMATITVPLVFRP
jgi:outer membrane biosynthesis protein TonB